MKENEKIDTNSKVAIVTGGAKGIGAEIVRTLAENGYIVILNYNNSKVQAEELKNEILDPKYEIAPLWQPSPKAASISGSSCIICVTSSNDFVACAPSFETK